MKNLKEKKLFLLDMDGTIYLGNNLFDVTLAFLETIKNKGGRYMFMTNNSSKSVADYVKKLNSLGIDASSDDMLTSTQALIIYLKKHYDGKKLYALGTKSFKTELFESGLKIYEDVRDDIDCLVMGFDTELTFKKLDDASLLLTRNIDYIAANPDYVCPTEYGYVPDCGSVSQMLFNATKKMPVFIGKPEPAMPLLALEKTGYEKDDALIVGDRLYTDIACGVNAGVDTVLVLSGESTMEDVEKTDKKPTYIMQDVGELRMKIS